jgi:hypothetical protein
MNEKRMRASDLWLIFGVFLILHLMASAISVVPNSAADTFVSIFLPVTALIVLISFAAAIYASVSNRKVKSKNRSLAPTKDHKQQTK